MKKLLVIPFILAFACTAMAQKGKKPVCITIQDGILVYAAGHYLAGQPLKTGYDLFGSNYQAHMFNGSYFNNYAGRAGFPPYEGDDDAYLAANPGAAFHPAWPDRNVDFVMKWNDAWLSNMDCDYDKTLDRHFGFPTYIGSGAWLTNHQSGSYTYGGKECHWTYFAKVVAVPATATRSPAKIWYAADGTEIGPDIWGEFAVIQEINNDTCAGIHGIRYRSPAIPGFGPYKP